MDQGICTDLQISAAKEAKRAKSTSESSAPTAITPPPTPQVFREMQNSATEEIVSSTPSASPADWEGEPWAGSFGESGHSGCPNGGSKLGPFFEPPIGDQFGTDVNTKAW